MDLGQQADCVDKRDPLMQVMGKFRIDAMYMDDLKNLGDKKIKATTCSSPNQRLQIARCFGLSFRVIHGCAWKAAGIHKEQQKKHQI